MMLNIKTPRYPSKPNKINTNTTPIQTHRANYIHLGNANPTLYIRYNRYNSPLYKPANQNQTTYPFDGLIGIYGTICCSLLAIF